jgi:hypothetical protein
MFMTTDSGERRGWGIPKERWKREDADEVTARWMTV